MRVEGGTSHISTLESSDEGGGAVQRLELPTYWWHEGGRVVRLTGEANLP
jgi:hypothetical protein